MEEGKELNLEDLEWVSGGELTSGRKDDLRLWAQVAKFGGWTLEYAREKLGSKLSDEEYEYLKTVW